MTWVLSIVITCFGRIFSPPLGRGGTCWVHSYSPLLILQRITTTCLASLSRVASAPKLPLQWSHVRERADHPDPLSFNHRVSSVSVNGCKDYTVVIILCMTLVPLAMWCIVLEAVPGILLHRLRRSSGRDASIVLCGARKTFVADPEGPRKSCPVF